MEGVFLKGQIQVYQEGIKHSIPAWTVKTWRSKNQEKNGPQSQASVDYTLKLLSLVDSKYWVCGPLGSSWHQKVMCSSVLKCHLDLSNWLHLTYAQSLAPVLEN